MRAVMCHAYGAPETLRLEDVPPLQPGRGQVIVQCRASGVNFLDLLLIEGKYQRQPSLPFSPGGEVAGLITRIGEGVDNFAPGDRVIAFCTYGGFAEELKADAGKIMHMPPAMTFEAGSSFILTYGTAVHALEDRARIQAGETLLVLGASGGAGLAAIEVAKANSATVIAAASSAEKLAICTAHGADYIINYAVEDLRERISALTNGHGVDIVFDPVGGSMTQIAMRGTAWGGRLLVVGFAAGEIPRIPLNLPLLKEAAILGISWGTFLDREPHRRAAHLARLRELYEQGYLHPEVTKTYPLELAHEAIAELAGRRSAGRVAVVI